MPKLPADPRLDGLYDLALRDGVDIRPTLLRVLTDLYVQKPFHTDDEETQYVALATQLIDEVDDATRAIVARTLRDYPATPAAVWRKLEPNEKPAPRGDELIELFFTAEREERRLILANLVIDAKAKPLQVAADTLARLESAALARKPAEFARLLAGALGIAPGLAERIVQDAGGEPLLVGAKALSMQAATLQRILLFLNPAIGRSVQRVYALADLYAELSPQAALQMVSIWRAAAPARKAVHAPVTVDDDKGRARDFASHAARRMSGTHSPPLVPAKAGTQR